MERKSVGEAALDGKLCLTTSDESFRTISNPDAILYILRFLPDTPTLVVNVFAKSQSEHKIQT